MDRYSKYLAVAGAYRGAQCDVELVTTLHKSDGTTQEISNLRRAVCKKVVRKRASTVYTFADIDLAKLDQIFPFETFTVADWPNIFTGDVGTCVPQGVGTARKVPLAWIDTDTATFWTYAGPKVVGSPGTVLTVYRGTQAGQGAIVSSSEYTVGTRTAPSGYQVVTVTFAREQVDFSGKPYVIEADFSLPGSRLPADELARVLALFGITTDSTSFSAAATYDTTAGFAVDAAYGGSGRTGRAIVTDLCDAARAWLTPVSGGAWGLTQDSPRTSVAQYDTATDLLEIDEYGDADVPAKVTLFYRPSASLAEDWVNSLSRTTIGASAEMQRHNPYIYAHSVADRYMSYWQKRLNATMGPTGGVAKGTIYAAQHASADRITVTDSLAYLGTKDFIVPGITRALDANQVTLREYIADVYVYAAGALPSDATNGYSPDYSYTPPTAPTGLAYTAGSSGTSTAADGTVRAYAYVSCTVPAVNWQKIAFQVTDTTTNEIYQAQASIAGTVASATIANLPPNRAMQVRAWATNSNNIDGAVVGPVSFTSATSSAVPSAPASATVGQTQSLQMDYSWAAVNAAAGAAPIDHYKVEESVNGGAFSTVQNVAWPNLTYSRTGAATASTYQIRVSAVDAVGNAGTTTSSGTVTAQKMINDNYAASGGLSGTSIANGSINQGRSSTASSSLSGTLNNGFDTWVALDVFTFFPAQWVGGAGPNVFMLPYTTDPSNDQATFGWMNSSGFNQSWGVRYRKFTT